MLTSYSFFPLLFVLAIQQPQTPTLAGRISTETFELPHPVLYTPHGGFGDRHNVVLVPLKAGGYKLGWNDTRGGAHITTLGDDLKPTDKEITLAGLELRGLVVHDDGYLGVLAAENEYRMLMLRLDAEGKRVFRTILTGVGDDPKKSTHLDKLWCTRGRLVASEKHYAVHFAHHEPGGHQGGYYAQIDFQGKKTLEHGWTVSHSLDQRLLYQRGKFFTMSLGDTYPRGIHFEVRGAAAGKIIYPAKEKLDKWEPWGAKLGSLVPAGKNLGLLFLSKESKGQPRDLVYLHVDESGRVLDTAQLTDTPDVDEMTARLAPLGDHLLLAWQDKPGPAKAALIDYRGKFLTEPVVVQAPLPNNDELVVFPNGDVGWVSPKSKIARVNLTRVRAK
jgi:hypothetical protein